ncbi:hypothetical protein V8C44DRAFT_314937 [Trichoderma aethiopicum]
MLHFSCIVTLLEFYASLLSLSSGQSPTATKRYPALPCPLIFDTRTSSCLIAAHALRCDRYRHRRYGYGIVLGYSWSWSYRGPALDNLGYHGRHCVQCFCMPHFLPSSLFVGSLHVACSPFDMLKQASKQNEVCRGFTRPAAKRWRAPQAKEKPR